MGIPNPILYFTPNDSLDYKGSNSLISLIWTDLNTFFTLTWKFNGDSKSDNVLYLKWLSEPPKFVIMIGCTINFDIIWYFCNICSLSILVNIRLIIWCPELRFYECCYSCFFAFNFLWGNAALWIKLGLGRILVVKNSGFNKEKIAQSRIIVLEHKYLPLLLWFFLIIGKG